MNPLYYIGGIVVIGVVVILIFAFRSNHPNGAKKQEKRIKDAKAKLAAIKKTAKPIPPPPIIPPLQNPNATETQGEINSLAEFPIGQKIGIEMTRIKEGTTSRIVVSKGSIKIKGKDPRKLLFFFVGKSGYYVNPKKIIKVTSTTGLIRKVEKVSYKLVLDVLYGEALNQDGSIEWDDELEMILADSGLDQYVTIAAYEGGFLLTPTIKRVMVILGVLGFLMGLAINGSEHLIPTTIIHWLP